MAELDLAAIKERCEAVHPDWMGYVDTEGDYAGRCELFAGPKVDGYRTHSVFKVDEECDCGCFPPSVAEMSFIEAVREDVPALLAEVDRLRAMRDRVTKLCDEWATHPYFWLPAQQVRAAIDGEDGR